MTDTTPLDDHEKQCDERASALLAKQWQQDEADAYFNELKWLNQASQGEIPHD